MGVGHFWYSAHYWNIQDTCLFVIVHDCSYISLSKLQSVCPFVEGSETADDCVQVHVT